MNATLIAVAGHRPATLPNCSRCGRFTSTPTVRQWCTGGNAMGIHICHEELLCPKCVEGDAP